MLTLALFHMRKIEIQKLLTFIIVVVFTAAGNVMS